MIKWWRESERMMMMVGKNEESRLGLGGRCNRNIAKCHQLSQPLTRYPILRA